MGARRDDNRLANAHDQVRLVRRTAHVARARWVMTSALVHLEVFQCEPYNVRLTRASCASRWRSVNGEARAGRETVVQGTARYARRACIDCPIGRAHSKGERAGTDAETPVLAAEPARAPAVPMEELFAPEPAREVERRETTDMTEFKRTCATCEKPFLATHSRTKYCSEDCRKNASGNIDVPVTRKPRQIKVEFNAPIAAPAALGKHPRAATKAKRAPKHRKPKLRAPATVPVENAIAIESEPALILRGLAFKVVGEVRRGSRVLVMVDVGGG